MFLHWKMLFKTRRHKYFYLLILALPRYPSFSFPKEICVSANKEILEGPVTPQDLHVKQAVRKNIFSVTPVELHALNC